MALADLVQQGTSVVAAELLRLADDPVWHEVALLTIGHLGIVKSQRNFTSDIVTAMLATSAGAVLAGEAIADIHPHGVTAPCRDTVRQKLTG